MEFEIFSISFTTTDAILLVGTGICAGAVGTVLGVLIFGRNYKQRIAALEDKLGIQPDDKKKEEPKSSNTKVDEVKKVSSLKEAISDMNSDINKGIAWYFGLINNEPTTPLRVIFFLMTVPIVFALFITLIFAPAMLFFDFMIWLAEISPHE